MSLKINRVQPVHRGMTTFGAVTVLVSLRELTTFAISSHFSRAVEFFRVRVAVFLMWKCGQSSVIMRIRGRLALQ
jgi:hypothetical protein